MKRKRPPHQSKTEKREAAIRAVRQRAESQALEFFCDDQRRAYATLPTTGHRETWAIRSREFALWVMAILYEMLGAAPKSLIARCLDEFEMYAICRGPMHQVHVRTAERDGAIYVDLGNERWEVVQITASGWHILDDSPVKFRRPMGLAALPCPQGGGNIRDVLGFLNVRAQSEVLLLAWLTYALVPGNSYPVVALSGSQGSGKSTITRVLRELVDPSIAPLTTVPRSERDLAIAATNSHLIAIDNLSEISSKLSDAICRVVTGGSFRTRELYTNDSEMIFTYRRPLIMNGIEELPVRPDLLDRSIIIHVEPIPENRRRDERNFWQDFKDIRPQLFGRMLDIIRIGVKRLPDVRLSFAPRMLDFARWGVAVEEAMEFERGAFLEAYRSNLEDANAAALDASPIAEALNRFLEKDRHVFRSRALELLSGLRSFLERFQPEYPELGQLLKHPRFPQSANQLSAELARIEPNLKKLGITIERGRTHAGRFIRVARGGNSEGKTSDGDDRDGWRDHGTVADKVM